MGRALSLAGSAACVVAIAAPAAAAVAPGWSVVPTPGPAGAVLGGVACSGAAACTAVGSSQTGNRSAPLAERWNGTALTVQPVPSPAGSQSAGLRGVSCPAATACTAVGGYITTASGYPTPHGLAERWDGSAWSIQTTPGILRGLDGVSCPTLSDCTAVGSGLAAQWNGTAWTPESIAFPRGGGSLDAVSCTAVTACIGVGSQVVQGSLEPHPLAQRWNGTAWSILPTPSPAGGGQLFEVSCSAATACTAVGRSTGNRTGMLAERWNGTAWSIQPVPIPPGALGPSLNAVSCPAATACTAVGVYFTNNTNLTLAERWNGTAWSIQPTPSPGPRPDDGLDAVACPTPAFCLATGAQTQGALTERFTD